MKMEYVIQTNELGKIYDDRWAARDISIHVPKGQIYGLLGRNGSGKTTVMKMLLGLIRISAGTIELFGDNINGYRKDTYARIGSTIEAPGFYPNLTASENLTVFARLLGKVNVGLLRSALDLVGLPCRDKKPFARYSLGMKQRLAIANAIMNDPDLLILDEPANGLDPIGIAEMRSLIKQLSHEKGKAVLISSHQLSEIEQLADWIGILHEGRMLEECSLIQLCEKEHPCIRLTAAQPSQAFRFLKERMHITNLEETDSEIKILDGKYNSLEINRALFTAGLDVIEISLCRNSLEDHFKELTGGVGIA